MSNIQEASFYVGSVQYAALSVWATGTAAAGDLCRQVSPTVGNERAFVCIVGGAKSGSEPAWTITRGAKTTDTSATWMEATGLPGMNGDVSQNWNNAKNTSVPLGVCIADVAGTHIFICTTSGTAGNGAEPSWNTSAVGNTTADNTATWTYIGLASSFTKFKVPHARMYIPFNNSGWIDGNGTGQVVQKCYIADNHAETQASGWTLNSRGSNQFGIDILCISHTGNIPPLSISDLATTGVLTTTGGSSLNMQGGLRWVYGLTFACGNSGSVSLVLNNENGLDKFYENCAFQLPSGDSSGAGIYTHGSNNGGITRAKGCTLKFSNTGQALHLWSGRAIFDNVIIDNTGSIPNPMVTAGAPGCDAIWKNSDLSNITGNLYGGNGGAYPTRLEFVDCKLNSSATFDTRSSNTNESSAADALILSRCSSAAVNYQFAMSTVAGYLIADNVVYRTGGATDNTTSFGWTLNTNASASPRINWGMPYEFPVIAQYNSKTGANRTVTVFGIVNAAAVPTNADLWLETEYLGSASSPLGTLNTTRSASNMAADISNLTADSSGWDTGVAARQNTHTYNVGDTIKTATNPGRIFYCIASSGNTAGSEPGGYASAVDGGSVTDGSATFRAGCRFKISVTLSSPQPQLAGNMYFTLKATKGSTTYTIDPGVVLS